jgi:hypothetical protein
MLAVTVLPGVGVPVTVRTVPVVLSAKAGAAARHEAMASKANVEHLNLFNMGSPCE